MPWYTLRMQRQSDAEDTAVLSCGLHKKTATFFLPHRSPKEEEEEEEEEDEDEKGEKKYVLFTNRTFSRQYYRVRSFVSFRPVGRSLRGSCSCHSGRSVSSWVLFVSFRPVGLFVDLARVVRPVGLFVDLALSSVRDFG